MNPLLDIIAGRETRGYYELRFTVPGGMGQEFIPLHDRDRVEARCKALAPRTDVYIGAAPRMRREGGRAAIENVWALWVDCDAQKGESRLASFPFPPTLEVASGTPGNNHCWFALSHPLPRDWAASAIRRLVHHLNADPAVKDIARVMRPPGTLNWKHSPAGRVEVVAHRAVAYSAVDLVADISDPQPPRPARRPAAAHGRDALEGVPVAEYVAALIGEPDERGRVHCTMHKGGVPESNPSMRIYEGTNTWHCWGCSRGGDLYELGAALWGLDRRREFVALRKRLCKTLRVET